MVKFLVLPLFFLSACQAGDVLSSQAQSTSETHNQPSISSDSGSNPDSLDGETTCTLECAGSELAYQIVFKADGKRESEIVESGVGALDELPSECQDRPAPNCEGV